MATKVFLVSPGNSLENVVEGVGAAIQSSFVIALTVDMSTALVKDNGTTRSVLKSEVQQGMRILEQFILRDTGTDWG